jgi:tetratricopeptide (TPR) repeat protein
MGYLALPGQEERVTMLLRDGRKSDALQALAALHQAGDRRPEIILQLASLVDEAGRTAQSIAYYTLYVSMRPHESTAFKRLAALHLHNGNTRASLALQERALKLAPTVEGAEALISQYQLHSRTRDEERLLKELLHTPYIPAGGLQRLGTLAANRGDLDTAITALESFDHRGDPADKPPRMLLFQLLIDRARYGEALESALRWSAAWKSETSAIEFAVGFARAGQPNLVRDFVAEAAASIRDFELSAANALTRWGHVAIAQGLLRTWITKPVVRTPKQVTFYIATASQAGNAARPFSVLCMLAQIPGHEMQAAMLAEGLADTYGAQSLTALRSLLSPRILSRRPIFAAQLSLAEGNATLARHYLRLADLRRASPDERRRWLAVAPQVDADGAYYALVLAWARANLQADFRLTLIKMAQSRGDWQVHNAVVAQAEKPSTPPRPLSAKR